MTQAELKLEIIKQIIECQDEKKLQLVEQLLDQHLKEQQNKQAAGNSKTPTS